MTFPLKKFAGIAIGNMLETYDFSIFGALADVIGEEFFPHTLPAIQLLEALGVFGAAFVMRPLGGVILGMIGDKFGRRRALELSIALMILPSFLIGCLPTYKTWGLLSTLCLVFLRLLQGLACGGEIVGSFVFTIEATGGKSMGFWGGSCKATGNAGSTLGMGTAALFRLLLTPEQLRRWGWRVPFFLGLLLGLVGLYLRQQLGSALDDHKPEPAEGDVAEPGGEYPVAIESSAALDLKEQGESGAASCLLLQSTERLETQGARDALEPQGERGYENGEGRQISAECPLIMVLHRYPQEALVVILVAAFWGAEYYSSFVWMAYFMSKPELISCPAGGVPSAWEVIFFSNVALVLLMPLAGHVGDCVGDRLGDPTLGFQAVMAAAIVLLIAGAVPAMALISTCQVANAVSGQALLVIAVSFFGGNLPALMVSMFPRSIRYSGVGVSYNLAHALFSGTAPIIQTALVSSGDRSPSVLASWSRNALVSATRYSNDGRLRAAFYLQCVGIASLLATTVGVALCKRHRRLHQRSSGMHVFVDYMPQSIVVQEVPQSAETHLVQQPGGGAGAGAEDGKSHNPLLRREDLPEVERIVS